MAAKRYPLPKRFNAALSEKAYARLRDLNARYHYCNNYLLTIVLEQFDRIVDPARLDEVVAEFAAEFGAPAGDAAKPES